MASKSRKTKTNKRYGTYGYGPNDHKLTSTKQALLAKFVKGDSAQSGYGVVWTSAAPENKKYHFPVMQLNNFGTYTKAKTDVLNDLQRRLESQNHTDKEAFLIQLASEILKGWFPKYVLVSGAFAYPRRTLAQALLLKRTRLISRGWGW